MNLNLAQQLLACQRIFVCLIYLSSPHYRGIEILNSGTPKLLVWFPGTTWLTIGLRRAPEPGASPAAISLRRPVQIPDN
jgi:hypothetical protein